ncbi:MAG TPA: chromate transporter [Beijerinckiaceae bacterium]|nr:chromate transporter [Beijerinckiaceae bacterium]HVB89168.1 chromate transporter [Beijerinckiaceae bacterium]
MYDNRLIGLILVFAPLSLLSIGGGQAIIADIQHQTVGHGWLTDSQFTDLFAISRAAPGPSTLIAALIGYQVAGLLGAILATLAIYIPSSAIVYAASSWWQRHPGSPLKSAIERGLAPVAVGLIFAGALAVMEAAHAGPLAIATAAVCTALLYFSATSAYLVIALVGLVYLGIYFVA